MPNSVYKINKGINKPIEFKGIKAQYLWYLGGGLLFLLILFAIMYLVGVNTYISLLLTVGLATGLYAGVTRLSNKYGEHGMMKKAAKKGLPKVLYCRSRKIAGFTMIENRKEGKL
ncbi:MAG: DUF4133 domain-containing protein [Bacteroidota bacterium]|nr:DUF4133 domain-containing protein [Bacteroidota bacterium]